MRDQDIKQIVKDKYGKAALAVVTAGGSACCGSVSERAGRSDHLAISTPASETAALPAEATARLARLRQSHRARRAAPRARPCSISAPAAASTCCSPRGASARPARPTAST